MFLTFAPILDGAREQITFIQLMRSSFIYWDMNYCLMEESHSHGFLPRAQVYCKGAAAGIIHNAVS
jgi:hypothetical protein